MQASGQAPSPHDEFTGGPGRQGCTLHLVGSTVRRADAWFPAFAATEWKSAAATGVMTCARGAQAPQCPLVDTPPPIGVSMATASAPGP